MTTDQTTEKRPSTHRSAGIVGLAIIGSRLFGLVREVVFASMFGAGRLLDAYLGAFQIPNLLRDLFAEGALSTAFTSSFTKLWETEGQDRAWKLTHLIISTVILVLGLISLLGIAASPLLVEMTNHGFHAEPGKFELTVQLTRILFPFILFVSLAAVVMGILNSRHIFGLPASASTAFNIVSVIAGVLLAYVLDPQKSWRHPHFTERALYGVCLGVLLGGLAQLAIQLPALWRLGYRPAWKINFRDADLRHVWALMIPSVIAGAAVQVNVVINGSFASHIDGGRAWLNCAFRLMQFPIGVFGVAIATVTLPAVARQHALKDLSAFGRTVKESLRLGFYLTIPASIGLAVMAEPLIRVIYQHGRFSAWQTLQTAHALQAYVIGLAGYAGIKVLAPCFVALNEPKIPQRVSLLGIGINLISNSAMVLLFHFGHVGLALTTGMVALINFGQLAYHLRKHVDFGHWPEWTPFLAKVIGASVLCGLAAHYDWVFLQRWNNGHLLISALCLGLSMATGGLVYFGVTHFFNLPETTMAVNIVQRKLRR